MAGGSRQIFISYARSDAERVDALVEGLQQLRCGVWLGEELTGGQEWWDTVLSQIRANDL
jgi:serine/threonine kinase PknH